MISLKALRLGSMTVLAGLIVALAAGCSNSDETSATTGKAESDLPDLSGQALTYMGFGEAVDKIIGEVWNEPFAQATGAKVTTAGGLTYAKIHEQVDAGHVVDDVILGEPAEIDANCGTYYEEADVDLSVFPDSLQPFSDCGVPTGVYSTLLAYDEDAFPDGGPSSCADFFDTDKYPGKRLISSYVPASAALECAAIAAGGDPSDPYPIDLDAAFAKLEEIKDDIVFADLPGQQVDAMANQDVQMGLMYNDTVATATKQGAPFTSDFGFVLRQFAELGIVKGTEYPEAAQAYVQYVSQPDVARRVVEEADFPFGIAAGFNSDQLDKLPKSVREWAPDQPDAIDVDQQWWIDNHREINTRWNEFLTQ